MQLIPPTHSDLLDDKAQAYAYLATTMPDGSPQVTPVWFNVEGELLLINTASGRVKEKNMRARSGVALLISDPQNPLRYVQVRGRIVDWSEEGALPHISRLSIKYRGRRWEPVTGQVRVIFRLLPQHVSVS